MLNTGIYCCQVHVYNLITLLAVSLLYGILHVSHSFIDRNYVSKFEESCLKHRIGSTCSQTYLFCYGNSITCVESDVVPCYVSLYLARQVFFQFFIIPYTVEKEKSARFNILYHVIPLQVSGIMTCYKVCLIYIIG